MAQSDTTRISGIFIQRVADFSELSAPTEHQLDIRTGGDLSLELNAFLIGPGRMPLIRTLRAEAPKIGDFCTSSPGIVTAANEFFILTADRAAELNVGRFTIPILKKGSFSTRMPIFRGEDFEEISRREPCRLLRIPGEPEALDEHIWAHIRNGEARDLHKRYKCRNRTPWYQVPIIERAPGFFFKRSHSYPRICVNEANVYLTDTAYGLRVKDGYTIRGICFSFYNSITMLFAEIDGRFYGGGVLELSPVEFRGLPLIYHEPTDKEFSEFLEAHEQANGKPQPILDFGDRWAAKKLRLAKREMASIRTTWLELRAHRLRHGSAGKEEL